MASVLSKLPQELPFDFLKKITDGFSKQRELGKGAFGAVYKGILEDGGVIAVKKLEENAPGTDDEKAFSTKVQNLMALEHENIVKVVAFCREPLMKLVQSDGEFVKAHIIESLLCYEYLQKGSLHDYLFEQPTNIIEWGKRFEIIKGVCQGLLFLHKLPNPIIHLDLKPKNILLDDEMIPKIGDFGFSRLFGPEKSRLRTQSSVGSVGYMSPEYLYQGEISARSDIYSLGVMILEITTGEKNWPSIDQKSARKFVDEMEINWTEDRIMEVYPDLEGDYLDQVDECIKIGLECVDIDQNKRPSIDQIVNRLNGQ